MTAYGNNSVTITVDRVDSLESKVNVNGENLIWINANETDDFVRELSELLDRYRI